ncbi:hypothetical protein GCM10010402_36980 [Actinomadura luteofluorescens]
MPNVSLTPSSATEPSGHSKVRSRSVMAELIDMAIFLFLPSTVGRRDRNQLCAGRAAPEDALGRTRAASLARECFDGAGAV